MTLVTETKDRLNAQVAALTGRVEEVADLAELVRKNALPQKSPAAFVLPAGFNAGAADAAAGLFRQALDQTIAVVLIVEAAGDPKAKRALAAIDDLIDAVLVALCGWAPAGAIADMRALRGRLVSVNAGTVIYQLDFAVQEQLRIIP